MTRRRDPVAQALADAIASGRRFKHPGAIGRALRPGMAVHKTPAIPDGDIYQGNGALFIDVSEPPTGDLSNPRVLATEADFRGREAAYFVRKALADRGVYPKWRVGLPPTRSKGESIFRRLAGTTHSF